MLRADGFRARRFEGDVEHLVDRHDGVERHRLTYVLGNVVEVGTAAAVCRTAPFLRQYGALLALPTARDDHGEDA